MSITTKIKMRSTAIIVAAGSGRRFGSELPKQFCMLGDMPVLMHTIRAIRESIPQVTIILVLNKDYFKYWLNECEKYNFSSPQLVAGGDTRWQSVKNAIDFIVASDANAKDDNHFIFVHDGARPVVHKYMVDNITKVFIDYPKCQGVIPCIPVTDSLRELYCDNISTPVDRSRFLAVQTPQAFKAKTLIEAYNLPYSSSFTDDATVVAQFSGGESIMISEGEPENIKITNPRDIAIARLYLDGIE